jgi:hypothetical protein
MVLFTQGENKSVPFLNFRKRKRGLCAVYALVGVGRFHVDTIVFLCLDYTITSMPVEPCLLV